LGIISILMLSTPASVFRSSIPRRWQNRIFFRNAINQGLALVQSKEAYDLIKQGEIITVDYARGEITTENTKIAFPPLPEIVMGILEDGGLIEHLKKSLKK